MDVFRSRVFVKKLKNDREKKKKNINDLIRVVSILRSGVHSGTKGVSGVEKSAIGRRIE